MTRIVGFDTATGDVTVALTDHGEVIAESMLEGPQSGPPNHAAVLMPEVERIVGEAGGWDSVDRIAVGVGPGSYTGLRIGVATARMLAQALAKPVSAVSTLLALGRGISELTSATGRPLLPLIDARRGEVFGALIDATGATRWEPFVLPPEALAERLREQGLRPLSAGSGALRFRSELEEAGAEVLSASERSHRVAARHLCLLAELEKESSPQEIKPVYLRAPDAARWIRQQHASSSK
jgi:tRNA threonylcarbamoyladenosine biosynthesis protein TsaB